MAVAAARRALKHSAAGSERPRKPHEPARRPPARAEIARAGEIARASEIVTVDGAARTTRRRRIKPMFVYEAMSRRPISPNMLAKTGSRKRSEMTWR